MKPLYCFKLDKETGEIEKIIIKNYEEGLWSNRKRYWRFRLTSQYQYCYEQDLDVFKTWKVYSFNDDIEAAKEIIHQAISDKQRRAYDEYAKYTRLVHKIKIGAVHNDCQVWCTPTADNGCCGENCGIEQLTVNP